MRRFGDPPLVGKNYVSRPGAYVVLPLADRLLLTFQAGRNQEFQLPGGGIDAGESPLAALHREVAEETGWRIAPMRRLTTYQRFVYMPEYSIWAQKICHIFVGRPIRSISQPTEPDHTAVWLPAQDALRVLASAADRHVLTEFFD